MRNGTESNKWGVIAAEWTRQTIGYCRLNGCIGHRMFNSSTSHIAAGTLLLLHLRACNCLSKRGPKKRAAMFDLFFFVLDTKELPGN